MVPAGRAEITWIGGIGNWYDSANWSGGEAPDGADNTRIDNGGTAQTSTSASVQALVLDGSSTIALFTTGNATFFVSGEATLGATGAATITAGAGWTVDFFQNVTGGISPGSKVTVGLTGATWSAETMTLGVGGNGTLTAQAGSAIYTQTSTLGSLSGSSGAAHLEDSTWLVTGGGILTPDWYDLTVGAQGHGEVTMAASQFGARNLFVGSNAGSTGTFSAGGGNVTLRGNLVIGGSGSGNATLTSTVASAVDAFLGAEVGSTGTATVSGGNLTLSGELHVGRNGMGAFTLADGATLDTDRGNAGYAETGNGTITITDGHWTNTRAIFIGVSGNGMLAIDAEGSIASESGYIAQNAAGVGQVTITGGTWTMSNTLVVGVNGSGNLTATGGAISSAWAQLGLEAGSRGVVTLDGTSWTTNETLTIGAAGHGEFTASNGASVSAAAIQLAASASGSGALTVNDSTLTTENILADNGGTAQFSGAEVKLLGGSSVVDTLLIDGFAPGAVVIGAGGLTVDTQGGNAQIESSLAGSGALTKVGAGRLRLNGANGFTGGTQVNGGVLEIAEAAALGSGPATVGGGELRAIANVTLSGAAGSPALLAIPAGATGTLSATSGNTLTVAVPSVTLGNGSTLVAGSAGNTGTIVFAPDDVAITGAPTVTVQAGTLAAGNGRLEDLTAAADATTVATGATLDFQDHLSGSGIKALFGAGTVNTGDLAATELVVHSGNFSGNIAGDGQLVKESAGTLVLSGQTAFTGGTTVNAGTLVVNGSLSFGFGQSTVNPGGTLSGNGIVGTITLNGGTLATDRSAGPLTAQNLYWQSGNLLFDLGGTPSTANLVITASLVGGPGTFDFTFVDRGWTLGTTYTLMTFSATSIAVEDLGFTNGNGFDGTFAYNGNALEFTVTSVPEPWVWAWGVAAFLGIMILCRRNAERPTRSGATIRAGTGH